MQHVDNNFSKCILTHMLLHIVQKQLKKYPKKVLFNYTLYISPRMWL